MNQPGIGIVESARESEGLETGSVVGDHPAEFVHVEPLNDLPGRIDHQSRSAQVIRDDLVDRPLLDTVMMTACHPNTKRAMIAPPSSSATGARILRYSQARTTDPLIFLAILRR